MNKLLVAMCSIILGFGSRRSNKVLIQIGI
jgi:hypothetical protein